MNLKKILVTESERISIMRKQGLILKEAVTPTTTLNVEKDIKFKGGYHSITSVDSATKTALDTEMNKIKDFLNKATGKVYLVAVQISSGESQIPNTDRELGGKKVEPGYLSEKRSKTIQNYVTQTLASFGNKLISVPAFDIIKPKIGATTWIGQPFCPKGSETANDPEARACAGSSFKVPGKSANTENWATAKDTTYKAIADKYKSEQFMKVKMKLMDVANVQKCLTNMKIQVNYTDTSKGHTCNSSVYKISLNGVVLKRDDGKDYASLNNGSDEYDNNPNTCAVLKQKKGDASTYTPKMIVDKTSAACKRYNQFTVKSDLIGQVLAKSAFNMTTAGVPKINIQATCLKDDFLDGTTNKFGGCHTGVGDIVVTNGNNQTFNYNGATPRNLNQTTTLATIDPCGASV